MFLCRNETKQFIQYQNKRLVQWNKHAFSIYCPLCGVAGCSAASRWSEISCSQSHMFDELEAVARLSTSCLSLDQPSDSSASASPDTGNTKPQSLIVWKDAHACSKYVLSITITYYLIHFSSFAAKLAEATQFLRQLVELDYLRRIQL